MNYCSNCGAKVEQRTPPEDDRPRYVCDQCRTIHYENPKMVVGCIPERNGRILLCRRAIEPCVGLWTVPAGYLENGETITAAARRETLEETGSQVEIAEVFSLFTLLPWQQVYLIFRARLLDESFGPTRESLEVRLFEESEIPWDAIAFETIKETLKFYYDDLHQGRFTVHVGTIPKRI